ncbi:universal stress protein [Mycolicibacterium moriokaense]|nr:universal stress protein [Mycolicibacterium moriokaense]
MNQDRAPVVVGVDGGDSALSAAVWAGAVAQGYETSLHIVHAMPSLGHNLTDTVAAIRAAMMSYQRDYTEIILRSAADAVRQQHPDLVVTTESTSTPADEALIDSSTTARMIVVGNSDVSAALALFVGSTTLAVATHAACPVVAWRGHQGAPTNQPIVVGMDATDSSKAVLESAFEFAERFGAKLAAVRSWSTLGPLTRVGNPLLVDWDALQAVEWADLTDRVDRVNKRFPRVSASCFVEPSRPHTALLTRIAVDDAQLVVVGSRGRNALASAVLGSTSVNLLHHATVPVMVCR